MANEEIVWRSAMTKWESCWNDAKGPIAVLTDVGMFPFGPGTRAVLYTCGMGCIYVKREDIPAFVKQMRRGLDMLAKEHEDG